MAVKQLLDTRIIRRTYIVTFSLHSAAGVIARDLALLPPDATVTDFYMLPDGDIRLTFQQEQAEQQAQDSPLVLLP